MHTDHNRQIKIQLRAKDGSSHIPAIVRRFIAEGY